MTKTSRRASRLLTVRQTARLYDVSPETVRRYVRKGLLPVTRVGPLGHIRIREAVARRYLRDIPGAAC